MKAKLGKSNWIDSDVQDFVEKFDDLQSAVDRIGSGWGMDVFRVKLEDLKKGEVLAWNDGEYTHYIVVE